MVVLGIASRDRRFVAVAVGALAFAAVAVLADPHLLTMLSPSADQGSIDVRAQRLPVVWQAVSAHPVTGLGYSGLDYYGVTTTDSSWLLQYAETGVPRARRAHRPDGDGVRTLPAGAGRRRP